VLLQFSLRCMSLKLLLPKPRMLVSVYQLAIVLGILCSYTINYGLHNIDNNWRWMFATGIIPSVLFFRGIIFYS